jgi:PilZ domain
MMMDRDSTPFTACRISSLYLDYGVDAQTCDHDSVDVSERGMRMRTPWRFEIGTQLAVSFVPEHDRLGKSRLTAEGIVVWCERYEGCACEPAVFESTVLFLELPDELKQGLRELSYRLTASQD